MSTDPSSGEQNWEKDVFRELATDYLKDKRRKRRWNTLFKWLILLWFLGILFMLLPFHSLGFTKKRKPHIGLVNIQGALMNQAKADNIIKGIRRAFVNEKTVAVVLRINSPGGSAVAADDIYNEIKYLESRYPSKKVYAICVDACASAAYYIASAAHEIYANPASLVGSIGVLYNGFGFVGTLSKLGVERRLITAGTNKGFMDPFSPVAPVQVKHLKMMLEIIHKQFENKVMAGRGNRLKSSDSLFSGAIWTGKQAKSFGLVDGFGNLQSVARDVIKNRFIVDYTVKTNVLQRFFKGMSSAFAFPWRNTSLSHAGIVSLMQ